jgi:hypothetical protein
MRLPLAVALIALALRGAYGQPLVLPDQGICPLCGMIPAPRQHAATGNPALDRAMAICDAHSHLTGIVDGAWQERRYEEPYAASCAVAEHQWDESATTKAQREAAKKEAEDLVWLRGWVQTLRADKP